jgi:hypothetical protein
MEGGAQMCAHLTANELGHRGGRGSTDVESKRLYAEKPLKTKSMYDYGNACNNTKLGLRRGVVPSSTTAMFRYDIKRLVADVVGVEI